MFERACLPTFEDVHAQRTCCKLKHRRGHARPHTRTHAHMYAHSHAHAHAHAHAHRQTDTHTHIDTSPNAHYTKFLSLCISNRVSIAVTQSNLQLGFMMMKQRYPQIWRLCANWQDESTLPLSPFFASIKGWVAPWVLLRPELLLADQVQLQAPSRRYHLRCPVSPQQAPSRQQRGD
jgi:hypothetical protein